MNAIIYAICALTVILSIVTAYVNIRTLRRTRKVRNYCDEERRIREYGTCRNW